MYNYVEVKEMDVKVSAENTILTKVVIAILHVLIMVIAVPTMLKNVMLGMVLFF